MSYSTYTTGGGTLSATYVTMFDQLLVDDYYVLFRSGQYQYCLAVGDRGDFTVSSNNISAGNVRCIVYDMRTSSNTNIYYWHEDRTGISVSLQYPVYSNLTDFTPRLISTEERSLEYVQAFQNDVFFGFFTLCIIFGLWASLRFRIDRRRA